ncbi:MAG: acyl-CoA dehydrogenase family protein [Sporichthyaceae bacterium]
MTVGPWASRPLFGSDHEDFRGAVRTYIERHVSPHAERWDEEGLVPREPWLEAGRQGFLGTTLPEDFGGAGLADYRFRAVMIEELNRAAATCVAAGFATHCDIAVPYVAELANPEQAKRWLPGLASGELIAAIAMTEPGAGSDLQGIRASARRDGSDWVLNGTKTFISNGILGDLVVVVARTDPDAGSRGLSLFVVERDMPGFERGRKLKKMGLHGQDTAELSFDEVRLPADNLLGEPGQAFRYLMERLPLERLTIAYNACAATRSALAWTLDYTRERTAFGQRIADFQNSAFVLAEIATELDVTQAFVDEAVMKLNRGELTAVDAAKAKWWCTEMHKRAVDRCVQLFGGYGYMAEYPIARGWADARVTTIFGGTTEIMKVIVSRDLIGR